MPVVLLFWNNLLDMINTILDIRIGHDERLGDLNLQPFQKGKVESAELLEARVIIFYFNF